MTQDVAEDVLGAAMDGNVKFFIVKVLILPIAICQIAKVFIITPPEATNTGPGLTGGPGAAPGGVTSKSG